MTNNTSTQTTANLDAADVDEEHRVAALSAFLDLGPLDDEPTQQTQHYGYGSVAALDVNGQEYYVLTEDEANEAARDYIVNTLWAFNASFLAEQTELPSEVFAVLQQQYEASNEAIESVIEKCGDMDTLVSDAIEADGRGHFLSQYDGAENEQEHRGLSFYIYRTN